MRIIQAIVHKREGGILGFATIRLVDGRTQVHCQSTVDDGYIGGVDLHLDDETILRFTYPETDFNVANKHINREQELTITLNFQVELIPKKVTITKVETINPYERRLIWDATDVHLEDKR